jgi:hypothetical protein
LYISKLVSGTPKSCKRGFSFSNTNRKIVRFGLSFLGDKRSSGLTMSLRPTNNFTLHHLTSRRKIELRTSSFHSLIVVIMLSNLYLYYSIKNLTWPSSVTTDSPFVLTLSRVPAGSPAPPRRRALWAQHPAPTHCSLSYYIVDPQRPHTEHSNPRPPALEI